MMNRLLKKFLWAEKIIIPATMLISISTIPIVNWCVLIYCKMFVCQEKRVYVET